LGRAGAALALSNANLYGRIEHGRSVDATVTSGCTALGPSTPLPCNAREAAKSSSAGASARSPAAPYPAGRGVGTTRAAPPSGRINGAKVDHRSGIARTRVEKISGNSILARAGSEQDEQGQKS